MKKYFKNLLNAILGIKIATTFYARIIERHELYVPIMYQLQIKKKRFLQFLEDWGELGIVIQNKPTELAKIAYWVNDKQLCLNQIEYFRELMNCTIILIY